MCLFLFVFDSFQWLIACGEAILGTQRYCPKPFAVDFLLAFGEAISGTQRYFPKQLLSLNCFQSSGEAIFGTQRYFSNQFWRFCFLASGEAILGTQRYFSKQFTMTNVSRHRRGDFWYTTIFFGKKMISGKTNGRLLIFHRPQIREIITLICPPLLAH